MIEIMIRMKNQKNEVEDPFDIEDVFNEKKDTKTNIKEVNEEDLFVNDRDDKDNENNSKKDNENEENKEKINVSSSKSKKIQQLQMNINLNSLVPGSKAPKPVKSNEESIVTDVPKETKSGLPAGGLLTDPNKARAKMSKPQKRLPSRYTAKQNTKAPEDKSKREDSTSVDKKNKKQDLNTIEFDVPKTKIEDNKKNNNEQFGDNISSKTESNTKIDNTPKPNIKEEENNENINDISNEDPFGDDIFSKTEKPIPSKPQPEIKHEDKKRRVTFKFRRHIWRWYIF